jgi:hypothetical protein
MAATGGADGGREWIVNYVERVRDLLADTARANGDLAQAWGERSLADEEWTAVSMTADAIDAWEQVTPLAGQGIDLWLELVQRSMPPLAPARARPRPGRVGPDPAGRVARYADLWAAASAKLAAGSYRSEDLVDDWFAWLGLAAKDATAALTLLAASGDATDPPDHDPAS